MGRYMAAELLDSDFFEGVDVIIPIPLHKKKQQFRDYNQSDCIARGIAAVMGIAVCVDNVVRRINKKKKTRKSVFERWE